MKKILFVQELYCDKNPDWQTNSIHNVFNSFIQSRPDYSFHRIHYDECQMVYGNHIDVVLPAYCKNNDINIVIITPLGGPNIMGDSSNPSIDCLTKLKEQGVYICYQWPDFGPSFGGETAKYLSSLNLVDLHLIWDNGWSEYHLKYPYTEKHLKLWVCQDNRMFCPGEIQDIPVSFLGSARYSDRSYFVSELQKRIPQFIFRGGQREENLGPYEYADLMRRSKISLNFSLSPANFFQSKGRVFEIMACKSLLLEFKNPVTASLFNAGKEYIEFSNIEELVGAINYYLHHEEERLKIAAEGNKKYLERYSAKRYWDAVINRIEQDLYGKT